MCSVAAVAAADVGGVVPEVDGDDDPFELELPHAAATTSRAAGARARRRRRGTAVTYASRGVVPAPGLRSVEHAAAV
jgi:hypothetical protein